MWAQRGVPFFSPATNHSLLAPNGSLLSFLVIRRQPAELYSPNCVRCHGTHGNKSMGRPSFFFLLIYEKMMKQSFLNQHARPSVGPFFSSHARGRPVSFFFPLAIQQSDSTRVGVVFFLRYAGLPFSPRRLPASARKKTGLYPGFFPLLVVIWRAVGNVMALSPFPRAPRAGLSLPLSPFFFSKQPVKGQTRPFPASKKLAGWKIPLLFFLFHVLANGRENGIETLFPFLHS